MADTDSTPILTLVHPRRPMTPAERAKNYRIRKKLKAHAAHKISSPGADALPVALPVPGVTPAVTPSRVTVTSLAMTACAFGLAAVGVVMNGWFARSLGASDIAGWLFLAIGVAADGVALAAPASAARLWRTRQRATAAAAWAVWLATFIFAVTAGIGFASTNIADVTMARASRITPAVTMAEQALDDARAARDRECRGGVGRFCREREATVASATSTLNAAMATVATTADPQTEAAMRIVAWLSGGILKPAADDFAMLRLVLLALLPQIGGILLMIGRARPAGTA